MTDKKPSMLDVHSKALEEADEAYHKFLLIYRKNSQCVYGFVEGKDDAAFYKYLIESQLPEGWNIRFIIAGNKRKVVRSLQSFPWAYHSKQRICFFIDRDLQDFLGYSQKLSENVYVTDGYSIENSILQDELIFGVLSDIYQITQLRVEEEDIIKQIIRKNEDCFFDAMMPLMGQILLWRRSGDKANLNNLNLNHLFSFSQATLVSVERKKLLDIAARQTGCSLSSKSDIAAADNEIRSHVNSRSLIRGKYILWFYFKQCEAISESITSLLPRFSTKPNKRIVYGCDNSITVFSPRARVPKSLREFVERNYLSFISNLSAS